MADNRGYQVSKTIRDHCVFARQDVTTDPPFSHLDIVSCRNLLIYFAPSLQKRVFPVLHYSLRQNGYLVLGSSETIGQFSNLFSLVDKKNKIDRKARLRQVIGGLDLRCLVDPLRFRQVVRNIFENSLVATAGIDGGLVVEVLFSLVDEVEGRSVRITVADNGPGLTAEAREKIFEPFYTTKTHGTGLGMAIARRISEAHGGKISLGSGEGGGTEIVITLPWRKP